MSNKFAWTWEIKRDCLDEYIKMHLNPWPDVMEAHRRAGIRNYSIFQNDNQLFYCFECDDINKAFDILNKDDACKRWNAITSKMVEGTFDLKEEEPISFLKEVFFLK